MSKKEPETVNTGKTVQELKDTAQSLQIQLKEYKDQANHYNVMSVKAQGALEVILQMIPKEEVEQMIEKEQSNGEVERVNSEG